MKDEEMAEEYICNGKCQDDITRNYVHCKTCTRIKDFLAGLKAGRPQWHDLRKDPNDLPTTVGRRFLVSNRYCTMIGYWNGKTFVSTDEDTTEIASPVAWCEIPTFDKE